MGIVEENRSGGGRPLEGKEMVGKNKDTTNYNNSIPRALSYLLMNYPFLHVFPPPANRYILFIKKTSPRDRSWSDRVGSVVGGYLCVCFCVSLHFNKEWEEKRNQKGEKTKRRRKPKSEKDRTGEACVSVLTWACFFFAFSCVHRAAGHTHLS